MKKGSTLNGLLSPLLKHLRMKKIIKFIREGDSILDIGCDEAYLIKIFKDYSFYYGIDINEKIIKYNQKRFKNNKNIKFHSGDIEKLYPSFFEMKFNTIILSAIVEHLKSVQKLFSLLYEITEDNAKIIITTPTPYADKILKIGAKLKIFSKDSLDEHKMYYDKFFFKKLKKWELSEFKYFEFFLNQLIILSKK